MSDEIDTAALIAAGAAAYDAGQRIDNCPHDRGSPEARAWREGWMTRARTVLNG